MPEQEAMFPMVTPPEDGFYTEEMIDSLSDPSLLEKRQFIERRYRSFKQLNFYKSSEIVEFPEDVNYIFKDRYLQILKSPKVVSTLI